MESISWSALRWAARRPRTAMLPPACAPPSAAKGLSVLGKADDISDITRAFALADNIDDVAKAFRANRQNIVGSYRELKKTVKSLGIKDLEVHHLIEKRFANKVGLHISNVNDIPSVALDKATHRKITNDFRDRIGYVFDRKNSTTRNAGPNTIWQTIVEVYEDNKMEQYIPILKTYILENVDNASEIIDWKGW